MTIAWSMAPSLVMRQSTAVIVGRRLVSHVWGLVHGLTLGRATLHRDLGHRATESKRERQRQDRDDEGRPHRPVPRVAHANDRPVWRSCEEDDDGNAGDRAEKSGGHAGATHLDDRATTEDGGD